MPVRNNTPRVKPAGQSPPHKKGETVGAPLPGTQGDDGARQAKRKGRHAPAGKNTVLYVSSQWW